MRSSVLGRLATATLAAGLGFALFGCGKGKEDKPIAAPPPRGAASVDELSTGLGVARGLDANLAPTSTVWRRVFVFDDKRAVLAGDVASDAVALITVDAGKTWRSLRTERDAWSTWGIGADGTLALTTGTREQPRTKTQTPQAPLETTRLFFAPPDAPALGAPSNLLHPIPEPVGSPPKTKATPPKSYLPIEALAAVLSPDTSAFVVEEAPRRFALMYGRPANVEPAPPLKLPALEKFVPTPFGRPPMLLSIKGRDLLTRPIPDPGKPLDAPRKVPNVVVTPALFSELSAPPACDAEGWSFQKVTQPPSRNVLLGVSSQRIVAFPLPPTTLNTTSIGCGNGHIIVKTNDAKTNTPSLALCDLEGACVTPSKPPFRPWPEAHEDTITTTPTPQGAVAIMSSRAGDRWGLYLSQSLEGGALYEVSRVIGEGASDRGRMDLGALISFGRRTLILLSADVTGTSRRGWYVIVSDDGGQTWNSP